MLQPAGFKNGEGLFYRSRVILGPAIRLQMAQPNVGNQLLWVLMRLPTSLLHVLHAAPTIVGTALKCHV